MKFYQIFLILILWLSFELFPCAAQEKDIKSTASQVEITTTDNNITFREKNLLILSYQVTTKSLDGQFGRANYVHPLYDISGTNVLTEDFPKDHPHQRGIFWAWHQVKVDNVPAGDSWLASEFEWNVTATKTQKLKSGAAHLKAYVQWRSPKITDQNGDPQTIVNETTKITVHPTKQGKRMIDFEIQLLAGLPKVTLAGSDDSKGYGGFSIRMLQPSDIAFLTSSGAAQPVRNAMDVGYWVDINGTFFGKKSGLAIFVHPSSSGFPQKWILRSDVKSMQNPVFPGNKLTPISQTDPTVLRYRVLLHRHILSKQELQTHFDSFAAKKYSEPKPINRSDGNNK